MGVEVAQEPARTPEPAAAAAPGDATSPAGDVPPGAGRTRAARRSEEGALNLALIGLGGATVVLGLVLVATLAPVPLALWDSWAAVLISWSYTGVGLVAWWRRPHNRMGPLLVAGGWTFLMLEMAGSSAPQVVAASLIGATLPLAVVLHLLMAFPSGRLRGWPSRAIVVVTYFIAVVLQAPQYLLSDGTRLPDLLAVASAPGVADAARYASSAIGTATFCFGAAILVARIRSADPAQRRVVVPLGAVGGVTLLVVAVVGFMRSYDLPGPEFDTLAGVIQPLLLLVLPAAFLFGLLRGGFARAGEVRELAARIGDAAAGPAELRDAIREALGDPTVELAYWVPGEARFVDEQGGAVALPGGGGIEAVERQRRPAAGGGREAGDQAAERLSRASVAGGAARRAVAEVVSGGRRVGAIVYDGLLIDDAVLVRSVAQLTALAIDRQRLTAELRVAALELRASRRRLAVASDAERRRIAKDLHDGAQQRLVLLAIDAQRLGRAAGDSERVRAGATRLREEVEAVLDDLRDLVHRIEPALLTERGLHEATAWLAGRMPIPTAVVVEGDPRRLPSIVESTAWFVVSEALANVVKHAEARAVSVRLAVFEARLSVAVRDDGVGGAELAAGSGLSGLADRVAAVGGRLTLASPAGEGTRLEVEVPVSGGVAAEGLIAASGPASASAGAEPTGSVPRG